MKTARLLCLAACAALLSLAACNPCHDSCARQASCEEKLDHSSVTNVDKCTRECEQSTTCVNRDEVNSCLADVNCVNSASYIGEMFACASLCKTQ